MNIPRNHHYAPQFYLRNFASDPEKKKIRTLAKNGDYAVWAERSIEGLGYERDLYVHSYGGVPVSVEDAINHGIETPISKSDTWAKNPERPHRRLGSIRQARIVCACPAS